MLAVVAGEKPPFDDAVADCVCSRSTCGAVRGMGLLLERDIAAAPSPIMRSSLLLPPR
jgi:hypothetical protein